MTLTNKQLRKIEDHFIVTEQEAEALIHRLKTAEALLVYVLDRIGGYQSEDGWVLEDSWKEASGQKRTAKPPSPPFRVGDWVRLIDTEEPALVEWVADEGVWILMAGEDKIRKVAPEQLRYVYKH